MKIQSLSVVVPTKKCINNCAFCVSKMNHEDYANQLDANLPFYDLYQKDYLKRLEFARDNGTNTLMLTGNGEPQQNRQFLQTFGDLMKMMERPFRSIDMQTTGTLLDDPYLRFLRNHVGVTTISLSVSSFYDTENNAVIKPPVLIELESLCASIKKYDFNLRLSINLTKYFDSWSADSIFKTAAGVFHADQVTFRVLYSGTQIGPEADWVRQNALTIAKLREINAYVLEKGNALRTLEYGQTLYDVQGMSVVVDNDCMNTDVKEDVKYLILRPNCKLYSKWDTKASLIF